MKKIITSLLMASILLISSVAMAAYNETVVEGADIGSIKKIAIALPMHYKVEDAEPTLEELTKIVFEASKRTRFIVVSYDEIVQNIKNDTGVDITTLTENELRKVYAENISKYADAYITMTSANNNDRVIFFFDVQNAADSEPMYQLQTQDRRFTKDTAGYTKACEDFFKKFDAAVQKALK